VGANASLPCVRIARYTTDGASFGYGIVEGPADRLEVAAIAAHPLVEPVRLTGERHLLDAVSLAAPVVPSKIIGVGRNYAEHAAELGNEVPERPLLFLKPSTSVIGPGAPVVHPADSERVDYEGELAAVIGRITRRVEAEQALEHVFGWTCANDVTARDHQRADGQWTRGKGHDSFCPLGPWIETVLDPAASSVTTVLDDVTVQHARTDEMIFTVPEVIAYISSFMTLLPGDVILTGTPQGVGPMRPGQRVTVTVEGIGSLTNPVVAP
jgi:2-keto-4-pentenoate hydratase/2-oxohepta-3-ene-1,7-dioic acid hydratase in catechol pathway